MARGPSTPACRPGTPPPPRGEPGLRHVAGEVVHLPLVRNGQVQRVEFAVDEHHPELAGEPVRAASIQRIDGEQRSPGSGRSRSPGRLVRRPARSAAGVIARGAHQQRKAQVPAFASSSARDIGRTSGAMTSPIGDAVGVVRATGDGDSVGMVHDRRRDRRATARGLGQRLAAKVRIADGVEQQRMMRQRRAGLVELGE